MFYLWSLSREVLYWAWHKIKKPCCWFFLKGGWGDWDGRVHTVVFEMDNRKGPAAQSTEPCSVPRGRLDGRRFGGGMFICVCVCVCVCGWVPSLVTWNSQIKRFFLKKRKKGLTRTSLLVQRLGLCTSNAGGGVRSPVRKLRSHPPSSEQHGQNCFQRRIDLNPRKFKILMWKIF